LHTATGFMREGRIRVLAATGAKRSPFDPDIPTIAESGFPGYAATNWYAVVVSSKTPPEIRIARETEIWKKVIADAGIRLE
jgi:tripartite-type tricarboxylate transporter receptor subunit TctC